MLIRYEVLHELTLRAPVPTELRARRAADCLSLRLVLPAFQAS
jgi:hypothetical protein